MERASNRTLSTWTKQTKKQQRNRQPDRQTKKQKSNKQANEKQTNNSNINNNNNNNIINNNNSSNRNHNHNNINYNNNNNNRGGISSSGNEIVLVQMPQSVVLLYRTCNTGTSTSFAWVWGCQICMRVVRHGTWNLHACIQVTIMPEWIQWMRAFSSLVCRY